MVDLVWGADRPQRPLNVAKVHTVEFAGRSTLDKYDDLVKDLEGTDYLLVTALDEIAWMLNLRGSDISFNPVFFSYLLIDVAEKSSTLFITEEKIGSIKAYLEEIRTSVKPYDQIEAELTMLVSQGKKIATDTAKCNSQLKGLIADNCVEKNNLIALPKSKKNETE